MPCSWAGRTNIPTVLAGVHPAVCREGLGRNKTVPDELHDSLATSFALPSRPTGILRELPLRVLTARNRGAALWECRGDGVDQHAVWHERAGQRVHEPNEGSLRGRVVGAYDASGKGGYRGDKDYSPPSTLSRSGRDPPGEQLGCPEFSVHSLLPVLDRYLLQVLLRWSVGVALRP
jgi:hypothetical protein